MLASGKYKFVKNVGRKITGKIRRRKTRRSSNPVRRNVKVARRRWRRKRGGGGKSLVRTAFKFIRIGALVAPAVYEATHPNNVTINEKVEAIIATYTGYSTRYGGFNFGRLMTGWGPYIIASLMTHGIPKLTSIIRRL